MQRRTFIATTAMAAAALSAAGRRVGQHPKKINFPNGKDLIFWIFFRLIPITRGKGTTEDNFRWMQDWGFQFRENSNGLSRLS